MKYQTIILSVLLTGLLFGSMPVAAQTDETETQTEQTQKRKKSNFSPETFLPREGDFAFSISANPFVNFIGNMFNGNLDNVLNNGQIGGGAYWRLGEETNDYLQPLVSIAGKYMLTDHLGVRVNVGWMYNHKKDNYYVEDDAAKFLNPLSHQKVVDSRIYNKAGASFNAAAEYRIGNRRIQGVVGGGLIYAFCSERQKFSYGNAITELNQQPTVYEGTGLYKDDWDGFTAVRPLSVFQGEPTHYFGLMGFVGFEWFLCPYFSLGAEVNLSALYNWTKATYYEVEGFNTITGQTETWTELISPGHKGFNFGTGNIGANLTLTFYFNRDN